jgi:hypothetical protein
VVPWALDLLDGKPPVIPEGEYMCWSYSDGPLVLTAAMRSGSSAIHAVLALDDRDDKLGISSGQAWKEWVRLSNWFGLCDNHIITTYSLLAAERGAPEQVPAVREVQLGSAWQDAYSQSFSTAEKELVLALAAAQVPVPEVGGESAEGDVLDFAWPHARVAVLFDTESETARVMADRGWTICPPDAERIAETLNTNGAR